MASLESSWKRVNQFCDSSVSWALSCYSNFVNCRINKGMNLDDFKFIYWMEYAHRMWGRALGIMFALPFSYFLRKGYITVGLGLRLSGLFALGAGQGLIGWWMVKSGLEVTSNFPKHHIFTFQYLEIDTAFQKCANLYSQEPPSEYTEPRVSPYRLAAHLTSAFAIYTGLLWTALSVVMPEPLAAESRVWVQGAAKVKRIALPVSILVGVTAVSGAFVAGNDAVCVSDFTFTYCLTLAVWDDLKITYQSRDVPIILSRRWVTHGFQMMYWSWSRWYAISLRIPQQCR